MCNKEIKFDKFYKYAIENNYDFIATGHYCQVRTIKDQVCLAKGKDNNKDQSYFLHSISNKSLAKTLFPVGNLTKDHVRKIASEQDLVTSKKRIALESVLLGKGLSLNLSKIMYRKNQGQ